jgi:diaminopimelate epimerase
MFKYEGLGNDFLVVPDSDRTAPLDDPSLIRALCDRHRGVGADGLLLLSLTPDGVGIYMELRNADGSFAETSGNGLRCAALAAVELGLGGASLGEDLALDITTDARVAHAIFATVPVSGSAEISVTMGVVRLVPIDSPLEGYRAYRGDVGNPWLVFLGEDVKTVDIADLGASFEGAVEGGQNVCVIAPRGAKDEVDMDVWERGVGLTQACGTGSCAGAVAAHLAGIVGERVVVHNPGGALIVTLSGRDATGPFVSLTGPTRRVARIEVELDAFSSSVGAV